MFEGSSIEKAPRAIWQLDLGNGGIHLTVFQNAEVTVNNTVIRGPQTTELCFSDLLVFSNHYFRIMAPGTPAPPNTPKKRDSSATPKTPRSGPLAHPTLAGPAQAKPSGPLAGEREQIPSSNDPQTPPRTPPQTPRTPDPQTPPRTPTSTAGSSGTPASLPFPEQGTGLGKRRCKRETPSSTDAAQPGHLGAMLFGRSQTEIEMGAGVSDVLATPPPLTASSAVPSATLLQPHSSQPRTDHGPDSPTPVAPAGQVEEPSTPSLKRSRSDPTASPPLPSDAPAHQPGAGDLEPPLACQQSNEGADATSPTATPRPAESSGTPVSAPPPSALPCPSETAVAGEFPKEQCAPDVAPPRTPASALPSERVTAPTTGGPVPRRARRDSMTPMLRAHSPLTCGGRMLLEPAQAVVTPRASAVRVLLQVQQEPASLPPTVESSPVSTAPPESPQTQHPSCTPGRSPAGSEMAPAASSLPTQTTLPVPFTPLPTELPPSPVAAAVQSSPPQTPSLQPPPSPQTTAPQATASSSQLPPSPQAPSLQPPPSPQTMTPLSQPPPSPQAPSLQPPPSPQTMTPPPPSPQAPSSQPFPQTAASPFQPPSSPQTLTPSSQLPPPPQAPSGQLPPDLETAALQATASPFQPPSSPQTTPPSPPPPSPEMSASITTLPPSPPANSTLSATAATSLIPFCASPAAVAELSLAAVARTPVPEPILVALDPALLNLTVTPLTTPPATPRSSEVWTPAVVAAARRPPAFEYFDPLATPAPAPAPRALPAVRDEGSPKAPRKRRLRSELKALAVEAGPAAASPPAHRTRAHTTASARPPAAPPASDPAIETDSCVVEIEDLGDDPVVEAPRPAKRGGARGGRSRSRAPVQKPAEERPTSRYSLRDRSPSSRTEHPKTRGGRKLR
ncbi:hypothetical protein PAPYR_6837 [Paratrimastix pyriformis]|uniref:FHA domain-containing protein n=1 Tax=Paratrimastix pyriformis TaxID=342808 RepID=A0ABQ8UE90_9EUKA|nr:hypothetical protein PAPYR_6837 [Paratrimastix pyriformis]